MNHLVSIKAIIDVNSFMRLNLFSYHSLLRMVMLLVLSSITIFLSKPVLANDQWLKPIKLADNIYAMIGEMSQRSPSNLGNNANFGFIVSDDGVLLIDSGGSYLGAKALHQQIQTITDKPILYVINTGGQDHRWIGNNYWKEQGAEIIASQSATQDQMSRTQSQLMGLSELIGNEPIDKTVPEYANIIFKNFHHFTFGDIDIEIHESGGAHTPGDSYVFLSEHNILFSGDIIYKDRLLGILSVSNTENWLASIEDIIAIAPQIIVPGHGHIANIDHVKSDSYDYLQYLRSEISKIIEQNGSIQEAIAIDQTKFSYLLEFSGLSKRNAQAVFQELEFK